MKNIILLTLFSLIGFSAHSQKLYDLSKGFDSVKVKKLLMTTVATGVTTDSVLVKKPNGGVFKVSQGVFATAVALALKQNLVTLTTTGSGAATFNQGTGALNIPTPSGSSPYLTSFYTDVSGTTTPTDAYSYTLAANSLSADGNFIDGSYSANYTGGLGSGSNIIIYFAGQVVYSAIANAMVTGIQNISFKIIRSGTTTARCIINAPLNGAVVYATTDLTGLDFTTTNVIKTNIVANTGNTLTLKTGTLSIFK